MGQKILAVIACCLIFSGVEAAAENIRVAVSDDLQEVVLKSGSGITLQGMAATGGQKRLVIRSSHMGTAPVRATSISTFIQVNGKSYRGSIELRKKKNGRLQVINDLDIEDYLQGVVASEIPHDWEFEALKAQAVASRTYAVYQKRTAGSKPYHILATVFSQVYNGKSGEQETAAKAVRETKGLIITYAGKAISAFYHSSCGGHTENAFALWNIDAPYLQGVDCECQEISRYGLWEKRLHASEIAAALAKQGFLLKAISNVFIEGITPAGRVKQIAISHSGGVASLPAERFRAAVGYSAIPSVFFETEMDGAVVVLSGRGLGHGVGLCQWGAKEMAQRGYDYRSILEHYYPGTQLIKRESQ